MKKYIYIFMCLFVFSLFWCVDVFASPKTFERTPENNYLVNGSDIVVDDKKLSNIMSTPAVDAKEKVYDFADLFTVEEEKKLYQSITDFIDDYDMDLVVVTIDENNEKTTKEYAHDFYDYNDFGIGDEYDGVLFLIDMDNREFYMTTTGGAIRVFTDNRINNNLDNIKPFFVAGNYAQGTMTFISNLEHYASLGNKDVSADLDDEPEITGIEKIKVLPWGMITIFAVASTAVVMFILITNNKLARKATSSRHYLTVADVKLKNEIFLGRNVHKSARSHESSSNSSSGGGSSTSSGSSGRSHGGGGRGF